MISIVIVNWNSGRLLERCVQSLQENARDCQVVIVDNASTDISLQVAAEVNPDLTLLCNASNIGFAAACNRGWQEAKGEIILFLNPDTECFPESIRCMEQILSRDPAVWAVGGCLIGPDGKPQPDFNVRRFPTIGSVAAEMFFIDKLRRVFRRKHSSDRIFSGNAVDVDQPAAACLMTTRKALVSIGGFDEAFYPAWFEDVDLCLRMRKSGGRIQFQPRARFLHHGGYSLHRMPRQDFLKYFHKNQIRYFRKHRGLLVALHVQKLITLGLLLRILVSLVCPLIKNTSRIKAAKIFWDALKNIVKSREAWT
ncbi:MAG: glycosyltransferase family 2 protein [Acidobacteria bacterium]|nr:glycosyltransferase family 2 protein [Acidobacteriota bacterium]